MKREIVRIDRELCNGCEACIPNCAEGALQMIDGKATLVSELMCDGLGACLGHCPSGAISIEVREADAYDEKAVLQEMIRQGRNVILAHLKHLKEHRQFEYLQEGVAYLMEKEKDLGFSLPEVLQEVHSLPVDASARPEGKATLSRAQAIAREQSDPSGGCPGSRSISFSQREAGESEATKGETSQLRQWPIQMHLINPLAPHFQNSDLLLAADCVAYSLGGFHGNYLKGKSLVIACPKLDQGQEMYQEKLKALIEEAKVNTIQVLIMEVPCCKGLLRMVQSVIQSANRKVPVKVTVVGLQGEIRLEEWV